MDSSYRTRMQLDPRYQMAQAMGQEATANRPAYGALDGLARVAQGFLAGKMMKNAQTDATAKEAASTQAMAEALKSNDYGQMSAALANSGDPDLMSSMLKQKFDNMNAPPKTRSYMDGDKIVTEQWDPNTRTFTPLSRGDKFKPETTGNGPVPGKSMQAWTTNTLLTGDPNSPEYAMAYAMATSPQYRQVRNPDGSQSLAEFTPNLPVRAPGSSSPSTPPLPTPTGTGSPVPSAAGAPGLPPPTPQAGTSPNLSTNRSTVNVLSTGAPGGQSNSARENMAKFDSSIDALMRYRQKLVNDGVGLRELAGMSSPLMTDYTDLFMGLKDINTLGALQAGDTEQLQKLVKDPSTFSGYMSGDQNLLDQLDNATNMLHDRYSNYNKQFPGITGKYSGAKYMDGAWYTKTPDGKLMRLK